SKRDWSSDVCSSDLVTSQSPPAEYQRRAISPPAGCLHDRNPPVAHGCKYPLGSASLLRLPLPASALPAFRSSPDISPVVRTVPEIGRASCRERVSIW